MLRPVMMKLNNGSKDYREIWIKERKNLRERNKRIQIRI